MKHPNDIRVVNVSHSDFEGGANRAAKRLHDALIENDVDAYMLVNKSSAGDWRVQTQLSPRDAVFAKLSSSLVHGLTTTIGGPDRRLRSLAVVRGSINKRLKLLQPNIVNLHWVHNEMCSIREIGSLTFPCVWTLHDTWALNGIEHYSDTEFSNTSNTNGVARKSNFKIDLLERWSKARKAKYWRRPIQIVAPSNWMKSNLERNSLLRDWPVEVIHNPIDLNTWKPQNQSFSRDIFNLPKNKKLVLFGAIGGAHDKRKGSDLLMKALNNLEKRADLEVVIFGQNRPKELPNIPFKIHFVGHLSDDVSLSMLYSACDIFLLPSRMDNLPNTGVEAMASGLPIVAFNVGGLSDIVLHKETGYLAKPFVTSDFVNGINYFLSDNNNQKRIKCKVLKRVNEKFSNSVISDQYLKLYQKLLEKDP